MYQFIAIVGHRDQKANYTQIIQQFEESIRTIKQYSVLLWLMTGLTGLTKCSKDTFGNCKVVSVFTALISVLPKSEAEYIRDFESKVLEKYEYLLGSQTS